MNCRLRFGYMFGITLATLFGVWPALAQQSTEAADPHAAHRKQQAAAAQAAQPGNAPKEEIALTIPDVPVVTQDGKRLRFYTDLVKNRTVAINFIFTTCTTICPPLGATFGRLEKLAGTPAGKDIRLISVSVDPVTDTPARLKQWAEKFGAGPEWTLVTGDKADIDSLLRALGAYTGQKESHAPLVLLGNDSAGSWTRANGIGTAPRLLELLQEMSARAPKPGVAAAASATPARAYFSDTRLVDQDGRELRFYSDLLRGKTVIISSMFATCTSVCPVMSSKLARVQEALGDRLGRDVYILSLSVDPEHDTPEVLKKFADSYHARPGWFFLTGKKENVDWALYKVGQYVEAKDDHSTLFVIGNEPKGVWKKVLAMGDTAEIIRLVQDVLNAD